MRLAELPVALRRAGVAQGYVWIAGVHEPDPVPPDFVFIRRGGPGFQTGVHERGVWHVVAEFADEDAACAHFLHRLAAPA